MSRAGFLYDGSHIDQLVDFLNAYMEVYCETDHPPTAAEEVPVIAMARKLREQWPPNSRVPDSKIAAA